VQAQVAAAEMGQGKHALEAVFGMKHSFPHDGVAPSEVS
jgi:hypothetical protein